MELRKRSMCILFSVSTLLLSQSILAQHSEGCSVQGEGQVSSALASLSARVSQLAYRKGKPIAGTLTLRAGPKGVYLPDFFQAFNETCEHGFAASLLTLTGKIADTEAQGCIRAGPLSTNDTAEGQLHRYIKLMPGETRSWQTMLPTNRISAGRYCLYAEYLSFGYMIDDVGQLPSVGNVMAKGRITAIPKQIALR